MAQARADLDGFVGQDMPGGVVQAIMGEFMGLVDEALAAPRLNTPRKKVAAGSVGIAERQTAAYPVVSPGGWNLIGLCPTPMFTPNASPAMPVAVGDEVRFVAIDKAEFLRLGGELQGAEL